MKLPRGLTGAELVRKLQRLGYAVTRQTGSHIRLTCAQPLAHHIAVPNHDPLRVGTLSSILNEVCAAHAMSREQLIEKLFD